ncbi:MAG: hypothetical protein ACM3S5_00075 [Rhodospirillales bacterium]
MRTVSRHIVLVLLACLGAPAQSPQPVEPAALLDVTSVGYRPDQGTAAITVVSRSAKPILAFGVRLTSEFADGSTQTAELTVDFVYTLNLVGKKIIDFAPGQHIGEFRLGDSHTWTVGMSQNGNASPNRISVVPNMVMFSDNTVVGQDDDSATRVFEIRQQSRDEYATHLETLRQLLQSPDVEAGLDQLEAEVKRNGNSQKFVKRGNSVGRVPSCRECGVFERGLESVRRRVASKKISAREALADYIHDIEVQYAAFVSHAEREKGEQQ